MPIRRAGGQPQGSGNLTRLMRWSAETYQDLERRPAMRTHAFAVGAPVAGVRIIRTAG
jgi:hypothetical protein